MAFFTNPFKKKDRKLGVAQGRARYDLPLQKSAGSEFLMLLVALMSFLALMALAGGFAMHDVAGRWSSGLENKATVEIPAREPGGDIREAEALEALKNEALAVLQGHYNVREAQALERAEIAELVSPWLGEEEAVDALPLPALISLQLKDNSARNVEMIERAVAQVSADIRIDTHESWLGDILRLAGTLQISALVVTLLIGVTTVTAIAGAIQSRMAEFSADIELLHLMGASDRYISGQFQRHSAKLALKGSIMGLTAGAAALGGFYMLSQNSEAGLMPALSLGPFEALGFLMLPPAVCAIAYYTARFTVLRTLSHLPL